MPMQPLSNVSRHADYRFGRVDLGTKPKIAKAVARCVACWGEVDLQFATFLTQMVHGNVEITVAMYSSITSAVQKATVLRTAAEWTLDKYDLELFSALMSLAAPIEKRRNRLAHWIWGRSPKIGNALLLVDPKTLLAHGAFLTSRIDQSGIAKLGYLKSARKKAGVYAHELKLDRRNIFVVKESDVLEIYRDITDIEAKVRAFCGMLMMDAYPDLASVRAQLHTRLCKTPDVAKAILRIRRGQKRNQKAA